MGSFCFWLRYAPLPLAADHWFYGFSYQWMTSSTDPFTYQLVEERIIDDSHDRDTLVSKTNRCSHHGKSMHLYLLASIYRCMEWMAYKIGCTVNGTGKRIRNDVRVTTFHVSNITYSTTWRLVYSSVYIVPWKCKLHPLTNPSGFVGDLLTFIWFLSDAMSRW